MSAETFNLSWNDFDICTRKTFQNLILDQDFTDVTLVCVDNKQIKAHKVILSACSPFFRTMLLSNPHHQHPLVYLKGIQYSELLSIIQFIYLGETQVDHSRLETFMLTAKELEIQGLITDLKGKPEEHKNGDGAEKHETEEKQDWMEDQFQTSGMVDTAIVENFDEVESKLQIEDEYQVPLYNPEIDNCGLITNIRSEHFQMKKTVNHEKKHACDQCEYRGITPQHVREHKMSIHEGIKFSCDLCDKVYSHPNNLRTHKKTKH
eukprot:TRINITY_DN16402_c0_g1_i1.p1 TRINITY_DN16402_c0_g1~~TRINITY_DN16402_c0_g1_i1.p1  ORF type:complete len:263 (-),score=62.06 TRINITY_DN16402_c0_g1_i1:48-836(-)